MVHPAIYAISIGVAIGVAVFAFFANNPINHYTPPAPTYRPRPSTPPPAVYLRRRRSSTSEDENVRDCSICSNKENGDFVELPCKHKFHRKCVTGKECPTCRQSGQVVQKM